MTQSHPRSNPAGRVSFVGAGPGDPGLITVRAMARLREADVLVHDALANPVLLDEMKPGAIRVDAGKRGGDHRLTQDQINDLLVDYAAQGHQVVRLKGGDPYLFGRGAEEVAYVAARGIECEVVPGVTSGIAAPATAGIPVTHRRIASTVTFVTGHEDPGKPESTVDYAALAALVTRGGTVCFYMGMSRLVEIVTALIAADLEPSTPVAAVQWGTLPRQRSVRTTLMSAVADVSAAGVEAPAIIVVGQVAAITEPGLDWFTQRPLFGQRIVVTRPPHQSPALADQLAELGAEVLAWPVIAIADMENYSELDAAIGRLAEYDYLVLTSVNGVDAFARRLAAAGLDARALAPVKIAVIGQVTADVLQDRLKVVADLVPHAATGDTLADALIAGGMDGKRLLLARADIAPPTLPRRLTEAGAHVDDVPVYRTIKPEQSGIGETDDEPGWITFTSSSTATHLVEQLGERRDLMGRAKLASIGPLTTQTLTELGYPPTVEAETSDVPGLVQAIVDWHAKQTQ